MLDVDGRDHVDSGIQNGVDILPAFLVRGAGRVRVRELVDQREARLAGEYPGKVELVECDTAVSYPVAGEYFKPVDKSGDGGSAVRFNDGDHDVPARVGETAALLEHRESLTDAGRSAEHDPKSSSCHVILLRDRVRISGQYRPWLRRAVVGCKDRRHPVVFAAHTPHRAESGNALETQTALLGHSS